MIFPTINITKPQAGQALVVLTYPNGETRTFLETDATKADALTDAIDAASMLGVDITPPG